MWGTSWVGGPYGGKQLRQPQPRDNHGRTTFEPSTAPETAAGSRAVVAGHGTVAKPLNRGQLEHGFARTSRTSRARNKIFRFV